MASASLNLKDPMSPQIKQSPIGFSWTVFLFGPSPLCLDLIGSILQ